MAKYYNLGKDNLKTSLAVRGLALEPKAGRLAGGGRARVCRDLHVIA